MKTPPATLPSTSATLKLAGFFLALALGSPAFADTTWNGTTADWNTPANWSGGLPAGTDVLRANVAANGNAVLPSGAYTVSLTGGGDDQRPHSQCWRKRHPQCLVCSRHYRPK